MGEELVFASCNVFTEVLHLNASACEEQFWLLFFGKPFVPCAEKNGSYLLSVQPTRSSTFSFAIISKQWLKKLKLNVRWKNVIFRIMAKTWQVFQNFPKPLPDEQEARHWEFRAWVRWKLVFPGVRRNMAQKSSFESLFWLVIQNVCSESSVSLKRTEVREPTKINELSLVSSDCLEYN